MQLLEKFLPRSEFSDYADFKENFKINIPENFDFARDVVDVWAANEPNKRALLYCTDEGYSRTFSFAEISELSKRAATWLSSMGISKGDRVMTLLRRRWEYWVIAVALCRLGAVAVPSSIQMTTKDIVYRLNTSRAKMLIALNDDFVLEQISHLPECSELKHIVTVGDVAVEGYRCFDDEFIACDEYNEANTAQKEDEFVVYFTSGTTGYPKMAVHNRLYPLGHIVTAQYMQRVQNNGLHLTQSDSGWAKFGWGNIYGQWICGSAILAYDPERFRTSGMMRVMETYKPTSLCIPPTMYRFLLHDGLKLEHVAEVKWFSTAGEPLSGEVNRQFYEITGQYIHEGFGQSEGTPITCGFQWLQIRPSSMGKPSPLYDVALVHPDGTRCEPGETGEVVIFGDEKSNLLGLLDYYYVDGKKINPVENGVYHTGDTAYEDGEGYYWYVGRADDMIKCSGYRIGPFEIESVLNTHPAVKESAIIGVPDPIRGQIVCAVIALSADYQPSEALTAELQKYVKTNTAPYKYPRKIVYIDKLPKTTSGKIIRNKVKAMLGA